MFEVIFLFALGLVWIVFAVVQDLRTREITNWLNYSLVIFAIGFRFFYSLFGSGDFSFFYQGLIGLVIFFAIANLFYYGKMFAGGDYRLMIALGPLIFFSTSFLQNLKFLGIFILAFLIIMLIYELVILIFLAIKNFSAFRKEFTKQFKRKNKLAILSLVFAIVLLIFSFYNTFILWFTFYIFLMPYIYFFVKAVDEVCMVKKVEISKVTEGDWLYKDVKVGKKVVKYCYNGLSAEDIKLLKKHKKFVLLKYGIRAAPIFLISFILFILLTLVFKNGFFGLF